MMSIFQGPNSPATKQSAALPITEFASVTFDNLGMSAVKDLLRVRPAEAAFSYVCTPNVDHVVRINRQPDFYAPLYRDAWLCLCDSRVLRLLARITLGINIPVVPGSDLVAELFSD